MILVLIVILLSTMVFLQVDVVESTATFNQYVAESHYYEQVFFLDGDLVKLAKDILLDKDFTDSKLINDDALFQTTVGDGKLSFEIIDQERFVNPNNFVDDNGTEDPYFINVLQRLFDKAEIDSAVLNNILDWIDNDTVSRGGEEIYKDYSAKNGKISMLDELKLINGVDEKVFNGDITPAKFVFGLRSILSPCTNGKVNINTASAVILQSLDEAITEDIAAAIVSYRQKNGAFKSNGDLIKVNGMNSDIIYRVRNYITTSSENYILKTEYMFGGRLYRTENLLRRDGNAIKEIWRRVY